ncbi:MAG: Ig-like domain-containing protein [Candidatus Methanomethylicia archaeon]
MRYIKFALIMLNILLITILIPLNSGLSSETLIIYTRKGDGKSPFLAGNIIIKDSEGIIVANINNPNYLGNVSDPLTMGYVFTLPVGTYHIEVYRFNILVGKSTVELIKGRNITLTCDVLDLPVVLVEEANQEVPVGNVTLKIYSSKSILIEEVLVGSNGKYIVHDLPYGEYIFKVFKFNITIAEEKCKIISYHINSTSQLSIKCKVGDLSVKLIDQNGRMVDEGVLEVMINNYLYDSARVSQGKVLFRQIPVDYLLGSTNINLHFKVYGIPVSINMTTIHMNNSKSIVIQSMLYDLSIKLNDLANRIVNNATLILIRNNLEIKSFNVDEGKLTITQIPEGKYVLVAKRFNISIAEKEVTVRADSSLVINCKVADVVLSVFDKYGKPISQVKINLLHNGLLLASNISVNETIRQLPLSKYTANLWREGVPVGNYLVDLTTYTEPSITYEIRNISLPSLTINCIDLNGKPILNFKILIYDLMIGNPVEATTSNGYILLSDLWPGKYVVMAEFEVAVGSEVFNVKSSRNIVDVPGTSLSTNYVLICPLNINGVVKVVDAYGNPIPHIPVNITTIINSRSYTWIRDTDEDGIARFNGLFGSKYLIQIYVGGILRSMQVIEYSNNFNVELKIYSVQLTPFGILEVWFIQLMTYIILIVVLSLILYYAFKKLRKTEKKLFLNSY